MESVEGEGVELRYDEGAIKRPKATELLGIIVKVSAPDPASPVVKILLFNGMMMMKPKIPQIVLSQAQVLINIVHHPNPQYSMKIALKNLWQRGINILKVRLTQA